MVVFNPFRYNLAMSHSLACRNVNKKLSYEVKSAGYFQPKKTVTRAVFKSSTNQGWPKAKNLRTIQPYQQLEFVLPLPATFAADTVKIPVTLGFTKENEIFLGRTAMFGFLASVCGEIWTGKGVLAQLNLETGIPLSDIEPLVFGIAALNLVAAFGGYLGFSAEQYERETKEEKKSFWTTIFPFLKKDEKVSKRNVFSRKEVMEPVEGKDLKSFLGIREFGFNKENELFVGRVAQMGFAASIIGEGLTGLGPLAQFGLETGVSTDQAEALLLLGIVLFASTALKRTPPSLNVKENKEQPKVIRPRMSLLQQLDQMRRWAF